MTATINYTNARTATGAAAHSSEASVGPHATDQGHAAEPRTLAEACDLVSTPDLGISPDGTFGTYGGAVLPPQLEGPMREVADAYDKARHDPEFFAEYSRLLRDFVGRPSPLTPLDRLSAKLGGATIVLKREDLNHTGAHKINTPSARRYSRNAWAKNR